MGSANDPGYGFFGGDKKNDTDKDGILEDVVVRTAMEVVALVNKNQIGLSE